MDNIRLIVGRVALLLLSFIVSCQGCSYQYTRQPDKPVNSCNLESPVPLELRCQVSAAASDKFTIQWHYSNSSSPPSQGNITGSIETILENKTHMIEILENITTVPHDQVSLISVLRLTNYSETASGHYWCTVNATRSSDETDNPSQVININICPFTGDQALGQGASKCALQVDLFGNQMRCADDHASINITNVHFQGMCMTDNDQKPTAVDVETTSMETTHASKPLVTTTEYMYTSEESTTTDIGTTFPNRDSSTISPSSGFPMHYVWMIVGIAFALLIAVIIVMFIAIVYLNHKKNKIKISSTSRNHVHNPYIEETLVFSTGTSTTGPQEIRAEAGYEKPTNMIHAHNPTIGEDHSPDSKTSSSRSALHSPPGEYEEVSPMKAAEESIKVTQRHQYEMVESDEQSEYSHLQHAHGGSGKFRINSTGTAPSPSISHIQGKVSNTSSLSMSGHQPEQIFDSPEYMTIGLDGSKTRPETGECVINADTGYSLINHEALKGVDTAREAEGPDLNSEGYHQLPSVFIGAAKQQSNGEISAEQRQNSHTTSTHPPAHRHKSATLASEPYTPIESANAMKRNTYSFSIVSTDEQYVSERGHVYQLLERSEEHQQNRPTPGSNEGSPKFQIKEDDSTKDRKESNTIPPYSQVNKSPKKDSNKQKETENNEDHSDSSSLQDSSMESSCKVIPLYSQVDKSKKKNRQPQFDNQETHQYHILEQKSKDKTETSSGEKGGPIYHTIDHEP